MSMAWSWYHIVECSFCRRPPSVRIEIVPRLAEAERIQRVAVVLGILEAAVAMDGGDGLSDVEPPLHQIVDEPDELRPSSARRREAPAPCDERRTGNPAVV